MEIKKGLIRTHTCGELRATHEGETVTLCGWVNKSRNLGGLWFVDLWDKYGVTQLSFTDYQGDPARALESVVSVTGTVRKRPPEALNKNMPTGEIEVRVETLETLGECDTDSLPFLPRGAVESNEDLRLKYRYLDLRTESLQHNLRERSRVTREARNFFTGQGFIEVETPVLYKSTPEGARDYLVPSRLHPGKAYALPQSPQTLKQLLMIGGTDKYFQICRCFRDEDLRHDRQPEFSQIDVEASFATSSYIKAMVEAFVQKLFDLPEGFTMTTLSYRQAMEDYGSDKPDLRFGLKHVVLNQLFAGTSFGVFAKTLEAKGLIKGIFLPAEEKTLSRKEIDALREIVAPHGGKGVAFIKAEEGRRSGGISKFIDDGLWEKLSELGGTRGIWLFVADASPKVTHACADVLRRHLGTPREGYAFTWVNDFPLLAQDETEGRLQALHHPFTAPKPSHLKEFFSGDPLQVLADAYDVVCNGYEMGGGSVRIHRQNVQARMFSLLGLSESTQKERFGFFLEALKYGPPPHAGIALGLDRIMMLLIGNDNIRECIAFPKTNRAMDLMSDTPSTPDAEQIKELGLSGQR